jgi:hypothetical protein
MNSSESFARLEQPVLPTPPVAFELEQETLAMTAVRNAPHTAGLVEVVGSGMTKSID